jgi:hypothetical protein
MKTKEKGREVKSLKTLISITHILPLCDMQKIHKYKKY